MPLMAGRALNSSIDPYGQYRMFRPFTFISKAMLPTDGRIDTLVCVRASCSCTTSPLRCTEYDWTEAWIPAREIQKRRDQYIGADEQYETESNLSDDERALKTISAGRDASRPSLQRIHRIRRCRLKRWKEAGNDARHQRQND